MDGWENTWEKADIFDWDTLLSLEVDPPLGINSLAVGFGVYLKIKYSKLTHFKPKKDIESTRHYSTLLYLLSKIFCWKDLVFFSCYILGWYNSISWGKFLNQICGFESFYLQNIPLETCKICLYWQYASLQTILTHFRELGGWDYLKTEQQVSSLIFLNHFYQDKGQNCLYPQINHFFL